MTVRKLTGLSVFTFTENIAGTKTTLTENALSESVKTR